MSAAVTVFQLVGDRQDVFDGSVNGNTLTRKANARVLPANAGVALDGGFLDLSRSHDLDSLDSFTVTATITPKKVGGTRQNIIEGQTPSIALFVEANGKLIGSIHTAAGWVTVDSGASLVLANVAQKVAFARGSDGKTLLQIDGKQVGAGSAPGAIVPVGTAGFRIGCGMDGANYAFSGTIADVNLRRGVVLDADMARTRQAALDLAGKIKLAGLKNVVVGLLPDESHARLQHVKDIMNAAGVQTLSDLDTLPIKQMTPLRRGQVLVAARKGSVVINWGDLAKQFRVSDAAGRQSILATHLINRNSEKIVRALPSRPIAGAVASAVVGTVATAQPVAAPVAAQPGAVHPVAVQPMTVQPMTVQPVLAHALGVAPLIGTVARPVAGMPATNVTRLRASQPATPIADLTDRVNGRLSAVDPALLGNLTGKVPALWPTTGGSGIQVLDLHTIPLDSAVVIAGVLDLTNQQLLVEPNVGTLYIIAEQVICGDGAAVTWRRPGGSTPARADDPDLNGRDFFGVQTKANSRDGLNGGDAMSGGPGTQGAAGHDAPNIEMWVKSMTGLPNLDFNGEDGIQGGRGQAGGRGGHGGDGHVGERWWLFGWHCSADPGDGGDGGNGGRGGDGGRGGNGGSGGKITIGVLSGTLASTVANHAVRIKNQGGRVGQGGAGGSGGAGGGGGRSGNGETCQSAKDGHPGAQGQPGAAGSAGVANGSDQTVEFFEFTQAAWDDLMTRPWITQITPPEAFPGDTLTIRGSRFTNADTVMLAGRSLAPTVNADQSISVTIPMDIVGGLQPVYVRRADGTESNRVNLGVKPELDPLTSGLAQGATATLKGKAFLAGASVLFNGATIPATSATATQLSFQVPGTGGGGSAGGTATVQVRNPDGRVSNARSAPQPAILEIPFHYGQHNLSFANFTDGKPDWGTFEDTFGTAEVWHELLDPIFGHPVLTAAYFAFYVYFLKGKGHGGLATGFCTSLSSLVADRFWLGNTDTPTLTLDDARKTMLTGQHGKLLSRQTLLTMHAQGREGIARVEETYRDIEATFLRGTDRQNQPLLFFIPSGEVWDSGYIDKLSASHCVMPYRFVYPNGRALPVLTPDGASTISDPDGVELFVWNCNQPNSPLSKLRFHRDAGVLQFDFFPGVAAGEAADADLASSKGITLGMMRHGDYMLADHDLPFSGPFGLTAFVVDFLLSPADLQVTDASGMRAGNFGGQIFSEIPGSHPSYLMKGMYLLPADTALSRTIVGTGTGTYDYHSILPDGTSIQLEGVATDVGHQDLLGVNADATQVRFTPAADKTFTLSITRVVNGQARAISVAGTGAGPANALDLTVSPDLTVVRLGNRGAVRSLTVKALAVTKGGQPVNKALAAINVPDANDLAITVADWTAVDVQAVAVPFQ